MATTKKRGAIAPQLTKEEVLIALRFLTEPERLNLHGHEARDHVNLVDKLLRIAEHQGVAIKRAS